MSQRQEIRIFQLKQYRLQTLLGKGGMGEIFKAYDTILDRFVAIKLLSKQLVRDEENVKRFFREARALARLHHDNITEVYDFGEEEGNYFIVMELLTGKNLGEVIRKTEKFTERQTVLIALEISKAIDYAHKQSILHRDIKPENIMITHQGRVKVLDFGIAKVFKAPTITKVEKILGTTEYMAPEQILGKKLDSRADIYSLGVLIYEMVNKTLPFTGESPAALVFKKLNEKPAPFNRDDISISFKNLILKMIATLPEDRHSDIGKVIHELEQLLEESGAESGENAKDASSQPGKKINIEFLNKISPKAVYSFLTKELIPGNFITILSILLFLASLLAIYSIPGIKNPSINLNHKISDIKRIYSMLGTEENEIALLEKLYISTFGKLPPQNSSRVQYKNTLIEILKGYYGINQ